MFQKSDFAEYTIPQLLQKIWEITDALKINDRVKYFFWLPPCKTWRIDFLREKWISSCLPNLRFVRSQVGGGSKHNVLPGDVCGQCKIHGISGAGAGAS